MTKTNKTLIKELRVELRYHQQMLRIDIRAVKAGSDDNVYGRENLGQNRDRRAQSLLVRRRIRVSFRCVPCQCGVVLDKGMALKVKK
jgi:hypothetical protein